MTERSRFSRAWPSLVALVGTVAVVLALLWAFGGDLEPDSDDNEPTTEESEAQETPDDEGEVLDEGGDDSGDENGDDDAGSEQSEPPPDPVTAPPELRETVGVLNATSIVGLAGRAQQRFEDGGWTVPATGDFDREIEASTIFYPDGMEESAEALRAQFPEVARVEPTIEGLANDRLIVVLADDYAEAVGETG